MAPAASKTRPCGPCPSVETSRKVWIVVNFQGPLEVGSNSKRTPHPPRLQNVFPPPHEDPPPQSSVVPKRLPWASKARALGRAPSPPLNRYRTFSGQLP